MRAPAVLIVLSLSTRVLAADDAASTSAPSSAPRAASAHDAAPIQGFTYSASGAVAGTVGAVAFHQSVGGAVDPVHRTGGRVFASPIDRVTLIGEAHRAFSGAYVPAFTAIFRLYGGREGVIVSAFTKGKAEGFSKGRETKGEAEGGVLVGYHRARLHADVNAITGVGLGDDRELDGETKLRVGYDVLSYLRVGVDGQARVRLLGDGRLAGNRTWDWVIGPQVLASVGNFYGAVSAGPSTFGYAGSGVGWLGSISIGATTL